MGSRNETGIDIFIAAHLVPDKPIPLSLELDEKSTCRTS
jgi:hypothetical protein